MSARPVETRRVRLDSSVTVGGFAIPCSFITKVCVGVVIGTPAWFELFRQLWLEIVWGN